MTIWKSKHKIENISASNTAMKLKLGEHVIVTHPVPDCYHAGMVTPEFDLEQTLSTSLKVN